MTADPLAEDVIREPSLFINAEDIAWAYRTSTTQMPRPDEHRLARIILNLHAINNRLAEQEGT